MQLNDREIELIASVRRAQSRAKRVPVMLFVCLLLCLLAFFTENLSIDQLAYSLTGIVLVGIFVPNGTLKIDELAELLGRVETEADAAAGNDLIETLSKR